MAPKQPSKAARESYGRNLFPRDLAQLELDALPKDEMHPFVTLAHADALAYQRAVLDAAGPVVDIPAKPMGRKDFDKTLRKLDRLKRAYRNKVAGDSLLERGDENGAREFFNQEQSLLDEVAAIEAEA